MSPSNDVLEDEADETPGNIVDGVCRRYTIGSSENNTSDDKMLVRMCQTAGSWAQNADETLRKAKQGINTIKLHRLIA